jgi:hypothetical protein
MRVYARISLRSGHSSPGKTLRQSTSRTTQANLPSVRTQVYPRSRQGQSVRTRRSRRDNKALSSLGIS